MVNRAARRLEAPGKALARGEAGLKADRRAHSASGHSCQAHERDLCNGLTRRAAALGPSAWAGHHSGSAVWGGLRGCGEVQAGWDGLDGAVKALEERLAAPVPAVADPVAAGQAEGGGREFGQDVQPEVFGVQPEFA